MEAVARIIGVLVLILWAFFIPVARYVMRRQGTLMHATIFQWNILPFITGVALLLSGNLVVLLVAPVLWFLAMPFPGFFFGFFPQIMGWVFGTMIASQVVPASRGWYFGGGMLGVIAMFALCTVITGIVATPAKST